MSAGDTASDTGSPMGRRKFLVALILCLIGIVILFALGTWQMERLAWKEALIARIEARIHSDPVPLSEAIRTFRETKDVDYLPVTLSGRFLNDAERFFFTTFDGQTGWNVYTPLLTSDDRLVVVNRGFIPYEARDPADRPGSRPDGIVALEGIARNAPAKKPGYFVPENDPSEKTFFWRDLRAMVSGASAPEGAALVPFFVDAGREAGSRRLPVGGQTIVTIPNNHLQYAFTWYGIGVVLLVMTAWLVLNQFRGRRRKSAGSGEGA